MAANSKKMSSQDGYSSKTNFRKDRNQQVYQSVQNANPDIRANLPTTVPTMPSKQPDTDSQPVLSSKTSQSKLSVKVRAKPEQPGTLPKQQE
jgi:hypothetical protein